MARGRTSPYTPFMRVLGIDPALAGPTGYGVVETDGRNYRSLGFGAVKARRSRAAATSRVNCSFNASTDAKG